MDTIAALHEPDQIAGGEPVCKRLGNRQINSSMGSQWKTKAPQLKSEVDSQKLPDSVKRSANMNVKLVPVQLSVE